MLEVTGWNESTDNAGFTETRAAEFKLLKKIGKDQRILDLGKVEDGAGTLNGKTYDTLWMPPFASMGRDALKSGTNKSRSASRPPRKANRNRAQPFN